MTDELYESDGNSTGFINKMYRSPQKEMMEMIYVSIINNEMGALQHDAPDKDKIEGLQSVLDFFKEREEYEKCSKLQKIIKKLYANNKG